MRQRRLGYAERAQARGAVVGDGRGVSENPNQQHDEIQRPQAGIPSSFLGNR